jgi:hypothetical protein
VVRDVEDVDRRAAKPPIVTEFTLRGESQPVSIRQVGVGWASLIAAQRPDVFEIAAGVWRARYLAVDQRRTSTEGRTFAGWDRNVICGTALVDADNLLLDAIWNVVNP